MTRYTTGDTIRLKGAFKTWAGSLSDLSAPPTLKIYKEPDRKTAVLTKTGADITKETTGTYYYDYTPTADGNYIYEFSGTGESSTVLNRGKFQCLFINERGI